MTAESVKRISDLFKSTYFKFNVDHTYQTQFDQIKSKGKWQFGEDNKSLILTLDGSENEKMIWSIKYINDNTLYLIKGITEEVWKFEVNK